MRVEGILRELKGNKSKLSVETNATRNKYDEFIKSL